MVPPQKTNDIHYNVANNTTFAMFSGNKYFVKLVCAWLVIVLKIVKVVYSYLVVVVITVKLIKLTHFITNENFVTAALTYNFSTHASIILFRFLQLSFC